MEKKVEFKVGDDILRGSLFTPVGQGPFPGVVFFHGRGSSRGRYLEISKRLAEKGFMALAFDFRGFVTAIIVPEFEFIKSIVLRVPAIFPEEIMDINVDDLSKYSYIERGK